MIHIGFMIKSEQFLNTCAKLNTSIFSLDLRVERYPGIYLYNKKRKYSKVKYKVKCREEVAVGRSTESEVNRREASKTRSQSCASA